MEKAYLHKIFNLSLLIQAYLNVTHGIVKLIFAVLMKLVGCFGPVVTAAVILHPHKTHPLLQDSKLLTEKKRLEVVPWIYKMLGSV